MAEWRVLMGMIISVALIIAAMDAQPAPTDCSDELANLAPCVKYISGGGDVKDPSQACCSALASIVKTNATCLCQVFTGENSSGVNQTQALQLPRACNVSTPSASQCAAAKPRASNRGTVFGPSMIMNILLVGFLLIKVVL